jgi:DNA polymerase-3 subunit epsilon/ATP-dependent DNA helicase DinG
MRGEIVAIDLETTGLDPAQDVIIEIGAVRLVDGRVVDEYSTLVHPGRAIPPIVTRITGISNDDLIGAPTLLSVLPALRAFVGGAPLLGHNISFDTSFLHKQGLFRQNTCIDTYDIASVLLPTAPRYALSHLAVLFSFDIESAHRALYDARATAHIYTRLWEHAMTLPLAIIQEIIALSDGVKWDARDFFSTIFNTRIQRGEIITPIPPFRAFTQPAPSPSPQPRDMPPGSSSPDSIAAMLSAGGALSRVLPDYEPRAEQAAMARAVAQALHESQHILIEAGTGTGKTLAYLLPALIWAREQGERVLVSTHTNHLQDQIIGRELETARALLPVPIRAAVLKGRAHYLCPREFEAARRSSPSSVDELRTIAKTLVWLLDTPDGERGDLALRGPEEMLTWQHMSADHLPCSTERCEALGAVCPFHRARRAAESADVVIVNHALLAADARTEQSVLPPFQALIVDEAHHLEDAATSSLSQRLDSTSVQRALWRIGDRRSGILGEYQRVVQSSTSAATAERITSFIADVAQVVRGARGHVTRLFDTLRALVGQIDLNQETHGAARLTSTIRARSDFASVQLAWHDLSAFFDTLAGALSQLADGLKRVQPLHDTGHTDLNSALISEQRGILTMRALFDEILTHPRTDHVYWIQAGQAHEYIALHCAPLHVGGLLRETLWRSKRAVILTSATLHAGDQFKFVSDRLSTDHARSLVLGSPFDYRRASLFCLPTDMPDPSDRQNYQPTLERAIIELATALNGRVLVLFTSYAQLRQTASAITPRLALGNITVYDQSESSSRQAAINGFRSSERAVLLGTRGFWEGIDIPGEQLSAVVIARLPFSVPTDPVFAARSETYPDSFNDYTVPDAIMRFRQGFGRLIRRATDRGVFVVLDSRITSKGYGHHFIDALPEMTVRRVPLNQLAQTAQSWLKDEKS